MKTKHQALILIVTLFAAISGCYLTGCAALGKLQGNPWVKKIEQIGLSALATYGSGGAINAAWGIAQGMYAISDQIKGKSNQAAAALIEGAAIQYAGTGNVDTRKLARDLAAAYIAAEPVGSKERKDTVVELGMKLQAAAAKGYRHD